MFFLLNRASGMTCIYPHLSYWHWAVRLQSLCWSSVVDCSSCCVAITTGASPQHSTLLFCSMFVLQTAHLLSGISSLPQQHHFLLLNSFSPPAPLGKWSIMIRGLFCLNKSSSTDFWADFFWHMQKVYAAFMLYVLVLWDVVKDLQWEVIVRLIHSYISP